MPIVPLLDESLDDNLALLDSHKTHRLFTIERERFPRYVLSQWMNEFSSRRGVRLCRRGHRTVDAEGVSRATPCGNTWVCPVCTPLKLKSNMRKSLRVLAMAPSAMAFTFTQKQEKEPLADSLDRLTVSMKKLTSGKAWATLRARYGIAGLGYVVELKHTPNGWHPHVHGFILSTLDLTPGQADKLALALRRRWAQCSPAASLWAQSVDYLEPEESGPAARYLQKDSPRYTTANPVARTLGDLVHDARAGDVGALALLHEAEAATFRRRRFTWTPGIEKRLQEAARAPLTAHATL